MNELVIQTHNFENAKKELKNFSEQTTTDLNLSRVNSSKSFGEAFGDWILGRGIGTKHNVTGEELNDLTSEIQTHLQNVNNTQIKLIKEFGQVYSALEVLDRDYIQAILISIKATEKTSESIQETQGQIGKIVENQRKTLEELKKFKQKLDGYAHLSDIDTIWHDCQKWHNEMGTLSGAIKHAEKGSVETSRKADAVKAALDVTEKKTETLSQQAEKLSQKLETVIAFTTALSKFKHLNDVDEMWESLYSAHDTIRQICCDLATAQKTIEQDQVDIEKLLAFMKKALELEHLMDVDEIWVRTEEQQRNTQMLQQTCGLHTEQLEELKQADYDKQEQINISQKDIENLKEYRERLRALSHLEEVDQLWSTVENCAVQMDEQKVEAEKLEVSVQKNKEDADKKFDELKRVDCDNQEQIDASKKDIESLKEYREKLRTLIHLEEVDQLWAIVENCTDQIDAEKKDVESLKEYREKLGSLSHLEEVDQLWTTVETCTAQMDEHAKETKNLTADVQRNKEDVDKKLDEAVANLTKRMRYAYWIAAGSAGLAVVELILLVMRIL